MSDPIIKIQNMNKWFGDFQVLKNINLEVEANKKIVVFGGKQKRPNIHLDDLLDAYLFFFNNKKIKFGIFNAGFENISIIAVILFSLITTWFAIIDFI